MKYFPFHQLDDKASDLEGTFLLAIIIFLVYIWGKLFLYWDK